MLKRIIFLILFMAFTSVWGQSEKIKQLETKVLNYNDAFQYEKSIQLITNSLNEPDASAYDKYYCYILKSYTYKRLFNYTKTLYYIDEA